MTLERSFFLTAAAIALSALSLGAVAHAQETSQGQPAESAAEMPEGKVLPDLALGDENAPVTFIEYASFTCNHCATFHNETFPKLKAEYIDTGKVKFIQRDVYFDGVGLWAGVLARCGGDERFYPVADLIFTEQSSWLAGSGEEIAANLRKLGAKAGMTIEQMDACWADEQRVADLVTTFQTNAEADEIKGTPTFVINGETVNNQPWDSLKATIDGKLAEAEGTAG